MRTLAVGQRRITHIIFFIRFMTSFKITTTADISTSGQFHVSIYYKKWHKSMYNWNFYKTGNLEVPLTHNDQ